MTAPVDGNTRCTLEYTSVMTGLALTLDSAFIAEFLRKTGPSQKALSYLQIVYYFTENQDIPKSESEYEDPKFVINFNEFRSNYTAFHRIGLQRAMDEEHQYLRMQQQKERARQQQAKEVLSKQFLKSCNNNYGDKTVKEIAAELNISIGEVRRRKLNGTL